MDQAAANIVYAAKPEITVHQWAFDTTVYVFDRPGSYQNCPGIGYGGTATTQALDAAYEWAKNAKGQRGIILATDGYPTTLRARDSVGNAALDLQNVLRDIRNAGVTLSVLCYGQEHTREHFDNAFGAAQYGLFHNPGSMAQGLLATARVMAMNHIKKTTR